VAAVPASRAAARSGRKAATARLCVIRCPPFRMWSSV